MDVILLQDVKEVGLGGAVVKVKDGYARNFLIPRGLAEMATPERMRTIQEIKRQRSKKLARQKAEAQDLKKRIEAFTANFSLNVGEDDKPFGSVTVNDIVEALAKEGLDIEKKSVQMEHPIKTLGKTDVRIRIHSEVLAVLKVVVVKA